MVVEMRVIHDLRHCPQRVAPRIDLLMRGSIPVVVEEGRAKLVRDLIADGILQELRRQSGIEPHVYKSEYFLLLPRARSTGYFSVLISSLRRADSMRSTSSLSASRTK